MATLPAAGSALYSKLTNAAGVTALVSSRVYEQQAPPKPTFPYVVYYITSGLMPNQTPRDDMDWLFTVEAIGRTRASAESVRDAIYTALHEQSLTIPGWTNYWLTAETVNSIVDNVEGGYMFRYPVDYRVKASED